MNQLIVTHLHLWTNFDRIQILSGRIQDYLNVNRKYYAACAQVFASIDTSATKTENYNSYAFKALVQQKTIGNETNVKPISVPLSSTQNDANWEELKQQTQHDEVPIQRTDAVPMNSSQPQSPPNPVIPVQSNPFAGTPAHPVQSNPFAEQAHAPHAPNLQPVLTSPHVQPTWTPQSPQQPTAPRSPQPTIYNPQSPTPPPVQLQWDQPQPSSTGVVLSRGGKSTMPDDLEFL